VKIGFVGGGAIGSYYAGLLARAGNAVRLIARGDHLAAIKERGLNIRTPNEEFVVELDATDDVSAVADCDFVIVSVKGYSLPDVAPGLVAAAKRGASIAPLLNGVDVAERLEKLGVPKASIIGGLAAVSLFRTAPGFIERRSPFDRIVLGELDRVPRDRTTKLVNALAAAGTAARESDDMPLDLWRKFSLIVPMTVACGLSRRPVGDTLASERGRALILGSLSEIVAVSRASGAALGEDDAAKLRADLLALPPGTRPSFLADLERGGPTELDLLAATVCRLGHDAGIPTPIHDVATAAFEAATHQA
jgi:2-dehydropantoate 2-reductase